MKEKRNYCFIFICIIIIFYITILSRTPYPTRVTNFIPLWSCFSRGNYLQLLLNIALFIPLGYFLEAVFSKVRLKYLWPVLVSLFVSISVELAQFLTNRGMLDVDDLLSNGVGACVGIFLWVWVDRHKKIRKHWVSLLLLTAGLAGCIITAIPVVKNAVGARITKQFWFEITDLVVNDGKAYFSGDCYFYDRDTPEYTLVLDGKEANTTNDGNHFTAEAEIEGKAEVQVKYNWFYEMPTGTWINPSTQNVEFVGGVAPVVEGLPEGAVLKAYNEKSDVLVYQDRERLLWLIGTEIDKNTEIIYHIYTDEPEKLPEKRVKIGFDNRGFNAPKNKRAQNEIEPIGHYRVFEKDIPQEYNVTAVTVGFNTDGTVLWADNFRVEKEADQ